MSEQDHHVSALTVGGFVGDFDILDVRLRLYRVHNTHTPNKHA